MSKRTDWKADILSRRLERASVILPTIRDHIHEQRRHVRVIGTPSLDPGRQTGTHSDPTQRTVAELEHWEQLEDHIDIQLGVIEAALNILDTHCRDVLGYHQSDDDDPNKPRCIGDNTAEGADCWKIPAPRRDPNGTKIEDGRCITCGFRWDAAKRAEADARRAATDARRMRRHIDRLGETA